MSEPHRPIQSATALVIGIGNEYRRDDGAGLIAARRIAAMNPPGTQVVEAGGEGATLIETWQDAPVVILIDAVSSGAPAGTLHRIDAHSQPLPRDFFHHSTHAFGVAEAIELARALDRLPPCLIVYGIEGKDFAAGTGLSVEVARTVETFTEAGVWE